MVYPSKLLLFGEFTVIKGSKALAIPYHKFSGRWAYHSSPEAPPPFQSKLYALHHYLQSTAVGSKWLDLTRFKTALDNGLYFDDHAGATAKRPIIDALMFVFAPLPDVVAMDFDQLFVDGFV